MAQEAVQLIAPVSIIPQSRQQKKSIPFRECPLVHADRSANQTLEKQIILQDER